MDPHIRSGNGRARLSRARARMRGFTFVELMVVITIIVILVTMAIPIYSNTIKRSKESVLKQNLFTLRTRPLAIPAASCNVRVSLLTRR